MPVPAVELRQLHEAAKKQAVELEARAKAALTAQQAQVEMGEGGAVKV